MTDTIPKYMLSGKIGRETMKGTMPHPMEIKIAGMALDANMIGREVAITVYNLRMKQPWFITPDDNARMSFKTIIETIERSHGFEGHEKFGFDTARKTDTNMEWSLYIGAARRVGSAVVTAMMRRWYL